MGKITTMECPKCRCLTKVNGIGAMSSGFAGFMSSRLGPWVFPRAYKAFDKAGRRHDWRYAILGYSKEKADRLFLQECLYAAKKNKYLRGQAYNFYYAVKIGGQEAYEVAQQECRDNLKRIQQDKELLGVLYDIM